MKLSRLTWKRWTLLAMMIFLLASTGCLTRTKFVIVPGFKSPVDAKGFLQVAQDEEIRVSVIGSDSVGMINGAGRVVLHKFDFARLVEMMQEHRACKSSP